MSGSKQPTLFNDGLPPEIQVRFDNFCLSPEDINLSHLAAQVRSHVDQIRQALEDNEFLDVKIAEQIASVVMELISTIEDYPQGEQKLIVGAAKYFVLEEDHWPDTKNLLGFDDDIKVLNYVLGRIGRPALGA